MDEAAIDAQLRKLFNLSGHRALVTGASSGLGRHFATTLAKAGASVAVAARRADKLAEVAQEIEAAGCRPTVSVSMNVTDRASVQNALDRLIGEFGVPDIVVNNAGVSDTKRALSYDDDDWDRIVNTNLKGAWIVAQESARRMVAAQIGGSIINVTSILASRTAGGVSLYSTSKAGLMHLTRSLALEVARHGIRVNSLAPGYVATALNSDFLSSAAGEKLRHRIPSGHFGTYESLDGPLLLLAAHAGYHMTGAEVVVDGGHLCSSL
jgi:NAD(P)-dependent dehydrogenase (short-subunit alcohol dehydrogenase family)